MRICSQTCVITKHRYTLLDLLMAKYLPIQEGCPEMPYFKVLLFSDTGVVVF